MTRRSNPHAPPPEYPAITARRLLVIAAAITAFPAALFAIEQPTAAATWLLFTGAVTTAITLE